MSPRGFCGTGTGPGRKRSAPGSRGGERGQRVPGAAEEEKAEEEERRLFYVGMTRAKNVLKICYVKEKNGKETAPSRFVDELLDED